MMFISGGVRWPKHLVKKKKARENCILINSTYFDKLKLIYYYSYVDVVLVKIKNSSRNSVILYKLSIFVFGLKPI